MEEADDAVPNFVAHGSFFDGGATEGVVPESVHALAARTGDDVICWPQFQAEFAFQVYVKVLVLLSMGGLGAAHLDEGLGRTWLEDLEEFVLGEEVLRVVEEEGCDAVGRLVFDAFFACVGGGFVQKVSHSVVE